MATDVSTPLPFDIAVVRTQDTINPFASQLKSHSIEGITYIPLGMIGLKEYYFNKSTGAICSRVPDIRESIRVGAGRKVVAADYSQIEVKIMTFLSGDPFLLNAVNADGKDFHVMTTSGIYNLDYDLVYTAYKNDDHPRHAEFTTLRAGIKTVTFGIPYGAGADRVAGMIKKTKEEAQQVIDDYFCKASVLKQWLDDERKNARTTLTSRSMEGRLRQYTAPERNDPEYRKLMGQIDRWAGNMPIQSCCADILKRALGYLYLDIRGGKSNGHRLWDIRIIICAHDEILLDCAEKDAEIGTKMLKSAMERSYNSMWVLRSGEKHYLSEVNNVIKVQTGDYWVK